MTYCTKKLKNIIFVLTILLAVSFFLGVASAGYDEVTVVVFSVTISAPNCTISSGASSCSTTVTWSTSNATSPNVKQDSTQFSTLASGSTSRTVSYGNSTFGVDNSTTL